MQIFENRVFAVIAREGEMFAVAASLHLPSLYNWCVNTDRPVTDSVSDLLVCASLQPAAVFLKNVSVGNCIVVN